MSRECSRAAAVNDGLMVSGAAGAKYLVPQRRPTPRAALTRLKISRLTADAVPGSGPPAVRPAPSTPPDRGARRPPR